MRTTQTHKHIIFDLSERELSLQLVTSTDNQRMVRVLNIAGGWVLEFQTKQI